MTDEPEVDQPGLSRLRRAVRSFRAWQIPGRGTLRRESLAGLTVTVSMVPDGMANGILAGVNPIYGLYANMVAPVIGGLTSSTRLMVINTTSAAALVAGQALVGFSADEREGALFLMVVLAGIIALALGAAGLGRITRFVSFSVMTGFIAGIAVVLVLSQLSTITGTDPEGGSRIAQTASLLAEPGDIHLPSLSLAAVTFVLVQGSGVSQSVPNPDRSRRDPSRDFIAQGAANVASGLFRGLPVGGSLGGTALNVISGAGGRLAGILSGVLMAVIVVGFPGVISRVVMPALGALLILAAVHSLDVSDVRSVWRAGWPSRLAGATTFVSALFLPIQVAVGFGVVLSALLYVNESSTDVALVEMTEGRDGNIEEHPAPRELASDRVTVLDVYGHLFYAGARTLERLLPAVARDIEHPVVVLRLRGRRTLGATLVDVLSGYADRLREVDGRLYVTGVGEEALEHLKRTGRFRDTGEVRAYQATPVVLEATRQAYADAETWLVGVHDGEE